MTGAEVGTFLGSGSTNGAVFDRSDPRTTTAPQPSTIMKPVRTPWKGRGPVFNGSVDSWVALAKPGTACAVRICVSQTPGLVRAGNKSRSPVLEFPLLARPASSSTGFATGKGFEPSVPLTWSAIPLEGRARDLDDVHPKVGFVEDSSLEEGGFEPSVPPKGRHRRRPVQTGTD